MIAIDCLVVARDSYWLSGCSTW